jgi:hypothetical protein
MNWDRRVPTMGRQKEGYFVRPHLRIPVPGERIKKLQGLVMFLLWKGHVESEQ